MGRGPCCEKMGLKKGAWTPEEDRLLIDYIRLHGHDNWRALPKQAGLLRCGKSCRLRWTNYLRPNVKRGSFTQDEEETIIKLHEMLGNRWSTIAGRLPGRTDNEIKNVWHTHLKKRLNHPASTTSATATVTMGPSKKRTRKVHGSEKNGVPRKLVSTRVESVERGGNEEGTSNTNNSTTTSIKLEPKPCTSEASTVTRTSNTSENDTRREVNMDGNNHEYLDTLPQVNDDFWLEVFLMEDSVMIERKLTEKLDSISQSGTTESMLETDYSNVNCEDMDVFWYKLLTKSHDLPEINDLL